MSATGKDTNASSTPSFISALVVAGITVGAFTAIWLILHGRKTLRRVYQPRIELAPESKRPQALPSGVVPFWRTIFSTPDRDIIVANGLDAYFFVRFLKVFGLQMLVPYVFLTFVVCIPLSVIKPNAGQDGLNKLTFGNVAPNMQNRHIGHFIVAIILISWTMYLIFREYKHFVAVRQAWLTSPQHLSLARTRTVAVTNVPDSVNSSEGIKEIASVVARIDSTSVLANNVPSRVSTATEGTAVNGQDSEGGVRQVWLTRQLKEVEKVWEERDNECSRLEGGVAKLLKLANKNQLKGKTPEKQGQHDSERSAGNLIDRYVLGKKRPTWKQGPLGLIGKKQDLETSPLYIAERNANLTDLRKDIERLPQGNTVFVRFSSQHEAHAFARLLQKTDKSHKLMKAGVEVVPEDVQWSNISMNPYQRKVRTAISWALTIGLIIIWAPIVAFVGMVSNVDSLCETASFLAWICTIPKPALGIIKGVLPPVLLAIVFAVLPMILRMFVKLQGEVLKTDIELKLFSRFWLFQVIHGFLIITLASGLISALSDVGSNPGMVPSMLASKLPNASIFFLTFILTATLSGAAKNYARIVPWVMYMLRGILGGNTPRKFYMKKFKMDSFAWATVFPPTCLLICITIVYSVIQPLICLLSLVAFCMLYGAYKYILNWCADQPDASETGGMFYIKALRTVFVSLYIETICLIGLFFLSTDQNLKRAKSGLACGAIMIVVLIAIAAFQIYIDHFRFTRPFLTYVHSTSTSANAQHIEPIVGHVKTTANEEQEIAGAEYGNTSGFHYRAFDHPALWKKQPVVWIADDPLGLGKYEAEQINGKGVEASTEFAHMDPKGKLEVERSPPDEAWYGGFTA
ncbi:hypothetical protein CI109_103173 [Kwoniella shandongensis]|uniref:Uncharacterized protein n=1 Tax=Kwoniella shandongensis TaxID=1734106 RepID=A0A5M6CCG6_9TREE|nr:uncharacterized protein CI109_000364 [Kwoniella shandongensis]KAA5531522.1 hypothetical protein CI109_000364 [Kwoniella shandongensis]